MNPRRLRFSKPPASLKFAAPGAALAAPLMDAVPAEMEDSAALPEYAIIVVAVEGEQTGDMRIVEPGALTWRELPLSLTLNHDPALVAGLIDSMGRVASVDGLTLDTFDQLIGDTGPFVAARVKFDLGYDASGNLVNDDALGREAARMVQGGFLLGVSMEVGNVVCEYECVAVEQDPDTMEAWCTEYLEHLVAGHIGAVTVCPFQAIESARVIDVEVPDGAELPAEDEPAVEPAEPVVDSAVATIAAGGVWYEAPAPNALVARALFDLAGTEFAPPAAWFENPNLDGPTPLTITADGQVFGHIATWDQCHIGRSDVCITPPPSVTDYAYFRTGEVISAEGTPIAVGTLTMNTGHADLELGADEAVAHYDHTGLQAMHLAAGEDEFGIWVAGALAVRGLDEQGLSILRAAKPSGDWRRIGTNLELVGVLAVNVPGFPVVRARTLTAGGQQMALVAAAAPSAEDCGCGGSALGVSSAEARLRNLEAIVAALGLDAQAGDALAASLRP